MSYLDNLSYEIIGSACEVQTELGPGLLESVYEVCLDERTNKQGIFG